MLTPDETMTIKTVTLEKVRRSAHNLVSNALLDSADFQLVTDMFAENITRVMYTVDVLGKKEVSEWTDRDVLVTAPGIWNNVKAWLIIFWARVTERREPRWMTPRTIPTRLKHYHSVYHMCPHINDWTSTKALHFQWLVSAPKPVKQDD